MSQNKVFFTSGNNELVCVIQESNDSKLNKLAVLLPGFCDSKDYSHLVSLVDDLTKQGFTVLRFDPTGTWESKGSLEQYNISQYLDDVAAGIGYAIKDNGEDFKDIVIAGHSLGGLVAMFYGLRDKRVSAVITIMSPEEINRSKETENKWKEEGYKTSRRDIPNKPNEFLDFNVPYSFLEDAKKYNILNHISELNKPLLVVTGELDDVVTPDRLEKIYKTASEPKEFINLKGIGHDYRHNPEEINIVNKEIIRFVNKLNQY